MRYALLFLPVLALFSCNPEAKKKTPAESGEALVREYFTHFNKHDWNRMAALYADSAVFLDPSLGPGPVVQTRAQVVQKYSELAKMFPDVSDEVTGLYPSPTGHVTVEFISRGTAPDGTRFELPICTVFTIQNGRITRDHTYYDNFGE